MTPSDLYLDLVKRTLTNLLYIDAEPRYDPQNDGAESRRLRTNGLDWPAWGLTMVGMKRLDNIQTLVEAALAEEIPGDLFEAGVWRGGAGILMRAILAAHADTTRRVWLADSFQGLPRPHVERFPMDAGDTHYQYEALKVSLETVKANFARFGLLDSRLEFVEGFFSETLDRAAVERIAVLRLDGDMYESTYVALTALYDKVSPGGFVIVDDYGYLESCRRAVADFLSSRSLAVELHQIDWTGVYWKKPVCGEGGS
ncbi:TylF/MycF/NovP-related O-methyltransferase [Methylocystis rosea]|uniref:TylF/MycF/NovP-related O-methyltransferase n=1 Tax=Methylocystis rosea TaxID=173366 RepID=UPI0003699B41|nr:TylF/MycF/NovP-related O-methyltransferase [Methylocystis rosea]